MRAEGSNKSGAGLAYRLCIRASQSVLSGYPAAMSIHFRSMKCVVTTFADQAVMRRRRGERVPFPARHAEPCQPDALTPDRHVSAAA